MHESFGRLKPEKKEAIVSAALREFAEKGYALASTNEIVKAAGISKGALFHYFGDKKSLYVYLCSYAMEILSAEYFGPVSSMGVDLIARLEMAVEQKLKLLARYPRLFAFCASLLAEMDPQVQPSLLQFRKSAAENHQRALFEGLDPALLKPYIPPEEGNRMLWWILEGYSNELAQACLCQIPGETFMQQAVAQFGAFTALVRKIFYR